MTTYFVDSAGSNTAPYDTEAKAATSIFTIQALPWLAGDVVKCASTHSETYTTNKTMTFPGDITPASVQVLSVAFNGSGTGALSAGATITGGTNNATMILNGACYMYGMTMRSGTGSSGYFEFGEGGICGQTFDDCTFALDHTTSYISFLMGYQGQQTTLPEFYNCTFSFANAGQTIEPFGPIFFDNVKFAGTAPACMFRCTRRTPVVVQNSDLSTTYAPYQSLVQQYGNNSGLFSFRHCKLWSGFALITGTPQGGRGSLEVEIVDCASGDTHYNYAKQNGLGTVTATNSIYADATTGTDSFSLSMVTTTECSIDQPLESPRISVWNTGTSAVTAKVPIVYDNATNLQNDEVWGEFTAKVTTGFPLGTLNIGDRVADVLASPADQGADSTTTWTGTGGFTNENKDWLESSSFTPAEVGLITGIVKLAKPSTTIYLSPKLTVA